MSEGGRKTSLLTETSDDWSAKQFAERRETLRMFPGASSLFLKSDGSTLVAGDTFFNLDYAYFLETIMTDGWMSFYNGKQRR